MRLTLDLQVGTTVQTVRFALDLGCADRNHSTDFQAGTRVQIVRLAVWVYNLSILGPPPLPGEEEQWLSAWLWDIYRDKSQYLSCLTSKYINYLTYLIRLTIIAQCQTCYKAC